MKDAIRGLPYHPPVACEEPLRPQHPGQVAAQARGEIDGEESAIPMPSVQQDPRQAQGHSQLGQMRDEDLLEGHALAIRSLEMLNLRSHS